MTSELYNSLVCGNCGEIGHLYKNCGRPITSMGIILFRRTPRLKYLMVCRKDSYGYVEFIRGKYSKFNLPVISRVVSEMTLTEIHKVLTKPFEELWKELWMETAVPPEYDQYNRNYEIALKKFNDLRSGYMVNNQFISLPLLVAQYAKNWREPEWGFPKGRRNGVETDKEAAIREFIEETGYSMGDFEVLNIPPLHEVFIGSNNLRYRHIYYIAELKTDKEPAISKDNINQITEISNIGFYSYDECIRNIRFYLTEKRKVLEKAHRIVTRMCLE